MRPVLLALGFAACGGTDPVPASAQALVFTAPAAAGHPAYRVQVLAPEDMVEALALEHLFPSLAAALHPAMAACGVDDTSAATFLLEGELSVDSIEGVSVHSNAAQGASACVAAQLAVPMRVPDLAVDARLPFAMVLLGT